MPYFVCGEIGLRAGIFNYFGQLERFGGAVFTTFLMVERLIIPDFLGDLIVRCFIIFLLSHLGN